MGATDVTLPPKRRTLTSRITYHTRKRAWGLVFVLPVMIFFAIFSVYPMLHAIYVSFFEYDLIKPKVFIGITNYVNIFSDPWFRKSVLATMYFIFAGGPVTWFLSFSLALLLKGSFPGRGVFRAVIFMPTVMSIIATAIVFKVLLQPYGPVNAVFDTRINWLTDSTTAMPAIMMMCIWRGLGFYMVLFLVGLEAIPVMYYEAASIDGANWRQAFRYVTLPLMKPTIAFVIVITLITGLKVFEPMYVMTRGGPNDSTKVLTMKIYESGFQFWKMGRASAMSVVMFAFILVFTLIQLRVFRTEEEK